MIKRNSHLYELETLHGNSYTLKYFKILIFVLITRLPINEIEIQY